MSKSWWLKLYTLPQLKFLAMVYIALTVLSCAGMWFFPEYFSYYLMLYLFPVFIFCAGGVDGIYTNLQFHKMTVPLKNLRWIFFKDAVLQFAAFFVMTFLSLLIPMKIFFSDSDIKLHPMLLALTGTPSYTFFTSAIFIIFALNSRTIRVNVKRKAELLPFLGLAIITSALFYMEQVFYALTFLFVVLTMRFYHFVQISFHLVKPQKRILHYVCLSLVGLSTLGYSLGCAYFVRYEMNVRGYSVGAKYKTMYLFADFLPVLQPETVRVLMKYPVAAETVFKNAHPDVYKMPVEMFIYSKDFKIISLYLKYGKPSDDNLFYLTRQMEYYPDPDEWKNFSDYQVTRNLLVKYWPTASTLPVDMLSKRVNRAIASEED